jgi:uncharacterized membrane protein YjgN (DUF898 family)
MDESMVRHRGAYVEMLIGSVIELVASFVIGALCPWCLTITVTTTLVFFSITRVNNLDGNLRFGRATSAVQTAVRGWLDVYVMLALLAVFAAMVAVRYL